MLPFECVGLLATGTTFNFNILIMVTIDLIIRHFMSIHFFKSVINSDIDCFGNSLYSYFDYFPSCACSSFGPMCSPAIGSSYDLCPGNYSDCYATPSAKILSCSGA